MFIFVAYKDAPELSCSLRRSSSDVDLSVEKTLLVNPDCPVRIMLEYIRKKCRLGTFTKFDLCDERGRLKDLFSMPTYAYATDLFDHKRTYYIIVIRHVNTESDKRVSVLPQVNRENHLYPELKANVHRFLAGELTSQGTPQSTPPGKVTPPRPAVIKSTKKK